MDAIVQCHAYVKLQFLCGNEEKLKCYSYEADHFQKPLILAFIQIERSGNVSKKMLSEWIQLVNFTQLYVSTVYVSL